MARRMARCLAALPEDAEVGHPRLHLQSPWQSDADEQFAQDPTWSPAQQTFVRDYEDATSDESAPSLSGAPLQNGSRPSLKVSRVDLHGLAGLLDVFIADDEQHELTGAYGTMVFEDDYLYGVRTHNRAMAKHLYAPGELADAEVGSWEQRMIPVRVEVCGERRWRSDWMHRTYDLRTIQLDVEDQVYWQGYKRALDEHRGPNELLPWDTFVNDLCRRPGDPPPAHHQAVVVHSEAEVFYFFNLFNAEI